MIINTETNVIQTNVGGTTSATMKVCPTAFKILSSQIYSDKVSAVIREVSCNALDAQNAAGNPNPIRVHLPTRLSPEFIVEDDGTGIDPSLIESLYLSYFESTKTGSNEDIGGFGCKSPLAYTDQFTVKNRLDGVETTYLIFFDATHVPQIKTMGSAVTDRPNGVTVIVPVRDSDISEFADKASAVFMWWDTKPEFSGYEIKTPFVNWYDTDTETELFRVVKDSSVTRFDGVLMGGVFYRVNSTVLHHGYPLTKYLFLQNTVVLPFEIGDLEVQASRESLSLDPYTVSALKERAKQINEYLRVGIQAKIDACEHASTIFDNLDIVEERLVLAHTEEFTFAGIPLNSPEYSYMFHFTDEQRKVAKAGNIRQCIISRFDLIMSPATRVYKNVLTTKYLVLHLDKQTHAPAVRRHLASRHHNKSFFTARTQEAVDMILEMLDGCDVTFHRLTDVLASGEVKIERSASSVYRGHLYKEWTSDGDQGSKRTSLADLYDMIGDKTYFESYCFVSDTSYAVSTDELKYILEKGEKVIFVNKTNLAKIITKGGKRLKEDYKPSAAQVRYIEYVQRVRRSRTNTVSIIGVIEGHDQLKEAIPKVINIRGNEWVLGGLRVRSGGIKSLQELHAEEEKKTDTLEMPKELVYLELSLKNLYPSVYNFRGALHSLLQKDLQSLLTNMIEFGKMLKIKEEECQK